MEITSRTNCQPAYSSDLGRLLRLNRERRGEEAACERANETPAF